MRPFDLRGRSARRFRAVVMAAVLAVAATAPSAVPVAATSLAIDDISDIFSTVWPRGPLGTGFVSSDCSSTGPSTLWIDRTVNGTLPGAWGSGTVHYYLEFHIDDPISPAAYDPAAPNQASSIPHGTVVDGLGSVTVSSPAGTANVTLTWRGFPFRANCWSFDTVTDISAHFPSPPGLIAEADVEHADSGQDHSFSGSLNYDALIVPTSGTSTRELGSLSVGVADSDFGAPTLDDPNITHVSWGSVLLNLSFRATSVAVLNEPPDVSAAASDVTTPEGDITTSSGAFVDRDDDPLTITCTCPVGSISDDGLGSWTWTGPAIDGPSFQGITVTATDPSGATAEDAFNVTITNVPPSITSLAASVEPVQVGTAMTASAQFEDPGTSDTHVAEWEWGDGDIGAGTLSEANGSGTVSDSHAYTEPGVYTVGLTVTDKDGAAAQEEIRYVVVYDPSAGFATGGGWIVPGGNSSDPGDILPGLDGNSKANFGFVVKYQNGASMVPGGNLEFHYNVGGLHLHSSDMEWLVVTNSNWAHFKGTATIDGLEGLYTFKVSARDDSTDRFVIKIWEPGADPANDAPLYKASGDLGGGQVKIHAG